MRRINGEVVTSDALVLNGLHVSHGDLMQIQGTSIGCATCWRIVGFACGDVTFAGLNVCSPNAEITALAEYYWRKAWETGESTPDVERIVGEFRAALRGQGRHLGDPGGTGGRHASG